MKEAGRVSARSPASALSTRVRRSLSAIHTSARPVSRIGVPRTRVERGAVGFGSRKLRRESLTRACGEPASRAKLRSAPEVRLDDPLRDASRSLDRAGIARDHAPHVGGVDDHAELLGEELRLGRARPLGDLVHDLEDGPLVAGRQLVHRGVGQGELDGGVHEDAAVEARGFDDLLDDVEEGAQLIHRRATPLLAEHLAEALLQPLVLHLERREHQVVLAREVLVEGRLADADVVEDLVDPGVPEAVPVEAIDRRPRQALARVRGHRRPVPPRVSKAPSGLGFSLAGALGGVLRVNPNVYRESTVGPRASSDTARAGPEHRTGPGGIEMKRILFFAYGVASHLMFLAVFAYMAGFVGNLVVPVTIDAPDAGFAWGAGLGNSALIALFGLQHSIMARPRFKTWWTRIVPREIERSTYVLVSNVLMVMLISLWQPLGPKVWHVENEVGRAALWTLFAAGWLMVPLVSLLINHFDLFGTRQVWLQLRRTAYSHLPFRTPGIYKVIRHPFYVGWMVAFWATPTMSLGHLLFAGLMTTYMLAAIPFEERDLVDVFGERYRAYRREVPALVPRPGVAQRVTREETPA